MCDNGANLSYEQSRWLPQKHSVYLQELNFAISRMSLVPYS